MRVYHCILHMNDDVVNIQTRPTVLCRPPFILVGSILGSILIDSQLFSLFFSLVTFFIIF